MTFFIGSVRSASRAVFENLHTDVKGRFEFTGVPEGKYILLIAFGDMNGSYSVINVDDDVVIQLDNIHVVPDGSVTVGKITVTKIDNDSESEED